MEIKEKTKAIGYIRVSTKGQAVEGLSIEAQEKNIITYCDLFKLDLMNIYIDAGVSGKKMNRVGLDNAMDALQEGQILIFYSLSRLTRSVKQMLKIAEKMKKKGVDLVSITEKIDTTSAAGRMVLNILCVMNEFESEQVAERTNAIVEYKRDNGEIIGKTKFGYKVGEDKKTLIPIDDEIKVVKLINALRGQGYTLQDIANTLNKDGIKTAQGKAWKFQYIHNVLKVS